MPRWIPIFGAHGLQKRDKKNGRYAVHNFPWINVSKFSRIPNEKPVYVLITDIIWPHFDDFWCLKSAPSTFLTYVTQFLAHDLVLVTHSGNLNTLSWALELHTWGKWAEKCCLDRTNEAQPETNSSNEISPLPSASKILRFNTVTAKKFSIRSQKSKLICMAQSKQKSHHFQLSTFRKKTSWSPSCFFTIMTWPAKKTA